MGKDFHSNQFYPGVWKLPLAVKLLCDNPYHALLEILIRRWDFSGQTSWRSQRTAVPTAYFSFPYHPPTGIAYIGKRGNKINRPQVILFSHSYFANLNL